MPYPDLDPDDWNGFRQSAHRMLDDMIDHLVDRRDEKVWRPMPPDVRAQFQADLPQQGAGMDRAYEIFRDQVVPYGNGNTHPRFMGWVHGGGNPVGMLAEMLAGGLNANLGGRSHAPILVERQVIAWAAEMLGLPAETAGGVLVTGTSIANLIAVLAARRWRLGAAVREQGLSGAKLIAYTSEAAHGCVARAMDMAGLGTDALRLLPVDAAGELSLPDLTARIADDRAAGFTPFMIIGTAGTVNTGAIDRLDTLADLCAQENLWFHIDGAFGALAVLSPTLKPLLKGIERADSIAFDFHKWGQVPYDAGCIMVRDKQRLFDAFAQNLAYLRRDERGLAGDHPWPCDLGPDLSRGFRALKVWMTLQTYGADRLGAVIDQTCRVAKHLADRVSREPSLELLAPVALNIVCFRVRRADVDLNKLNAQIIVAVQESGVAAPSATTLNGHLAIRAAIVNHRVRPEDADMLVDSVLAEAARLS